MLTSSLRARWDCIPPFFENFDDQSITLAVDLVEVALAVGVDVENADRAALNIVDRNHHLRPGAIVARDVARKGMDIVHDLSRILVNGGPTHADVFLQYQAGNWTLVRVDHKLPVLEQIKAGPRNPRDLVVEESRRGRAVGHRVVGLGNQLFELLRDPPVAIEVR
jgi:hypothetical protein